MSSDAFLVATHALSLCQEFQRKLAQLNPERRRLSEKLKNMSLNNVPG